MTGRYLAGRAVSPIGLGCNNLGTRVDDSRSIEMVRAAVDAGVNHFDTADVYGMGRSEEILGKALGTQREQVVIATKFGRQMTGDPTGGGASASWARTALDASLRRLRTDYVDLYYLHLPDPTVPVGETLVALTELISAGKIRAIGISAVSDAQLRHADQQARALETERFEVVQNEYSVLVRDAEKAVLPACRQMGVGFIPFFPLASGVLAGRYSSPDDLPPTARLAGHPRLRQRYFNQRTSPIINGIKILADQARRPMTDLALGWLLSRPGVTAVIAGASSIEQMLSNLRAAEVSLSADLLTQMDRLTKN